jgi:Cu+-exporting ATPase
MEGVHKITINFAVEKALVAFDPSQTSTEKIVETVKNAGYTAIPEDNNNHDNHEPTHKDDHNSHKEDHSAHASAESGKALRSKLFKVIFGAGVSIVLTIFDFAINVPYEGYIMFATTLAVILYTGHEFFTKGTPNLIKGRPNMDTLIALGITAAFLYSSYNIFVTQTGEQYFMDAAIIATFIMLGRYLEAKAKGQASEAIKKLLKLSAKTAHKVIGKNKTEDVPIDQIQKSDLLLVKPGEKIPTDGEIVEGTATIDESMVTGESIPSDKEKGDKIIGATINGNTAFTMRAEKIGAETMLSQMIKLVEEAQMKKAPIQKLADTISGYFVWGVIVIALVTMGIWYWLTGDVSSTLIPTVAVLIIACPCALGLATPISIITGSGKGASMGILLKNPESLEKMHKITTICFDKTGTITKGKPEVQTFETIKGNDKKIVLQIALSLETLSEHPLAESIVKYAEEQKITAKTVKNFKAITGKGVTGNIDGTQYHLGSISYTKSLKEFDDLNEKGQTVLVLTNGEKVIGYFGVQDSVKETSKEAIDILHNKGIKTVMMTGDNEKVARAIAEKVGIDEVLAKASPQDKVKKIHALQKQNEFVTMVGDGINDAPALATADVGIAIGTGTDVAIESGDIVLVKGDLLKAAEAIELSKATMRNIKQNLFWAFVYNSIGIPIAALGLLNPIFSSAAMAFSSISVVLNALRLKRFKA